MTDLDFLNEELANEYGASDAILKAVLPGGKVVHISDNISPFKFLDTCPLLYHTFEYNAQSRLQANIEASSENAVISLVRYCYTGSYLAGEPDGESVLLLQHAETYKIAEDFDVPELQIMAHGNFSCQIEYAACLPLPPKDLLDTIRFTYRHYASDEARRKHNLVDTLLNYCVAVYLYHKLGKSLDFLTAVHEISAFRQDLCRTNIARNFEDDCAAEIIRLPGGSAAESSIPPTTLSSRDLPNEMLYDLPREPVPAGPSSVDQTPTNSAQAEQDRVPISLSSLCKAMNARSYRREIPEQTKHSVSPSELTAALEKYSKTIQSDNEPESTVEDTMCKRKRAWMDDALSPLSGRPTLPEIGPWNETLRQEETAVKSESATMSHEESYWKGAFGQDKTKHSKFFTEGTSHSARRLIFEYGRRNAQPAQRTALSPPTVNTDAATVALPHRPSNPETAPGASPAIDTASEDEGFAMVHRSQTAVGTTLDSPMSSPELVPMTSGAQTIVDDKTASDDDWTML